MRTLLLLLVASSGCAYLRPVTAESMTLVTSRPCAQGPLRIETTTLGARWGEWYELRLLSPRGLKGHLRWRVADDKRAKEPWVTSFTVKEGRDERLVADTVFDQRRCLERPPVFVVEAPGATASPPAPLPQPMPAVVQPLPGPPPLPQQSRAEPAPWPSAPAPLAQGTVGVEVSVSLPRPPVTVTSPLPEEPGFEPLAFPQGPDVTPVQLVPGVGSSNAHATFLFRWQRRNEDAHAPPPVPPGQPVVIEVWSDQPNDYQGAAFIFARGPLEPNVSEAEWLAELARREERRARNEAEEAARAAEDRRARAEAAAKQRVIDDERRRVERLEFEQRRAANIAAREAKLAQPAVETAYEKERREKYAGGLAAPSRPDPEYLEARRREVERQRAEAAAEAAARLRWRAEQERRWAEEEARRPRPRPEPSGPPPPPPAQSIPPRPAPYVLWIDGYYEWTGAAWVWLEGWWKVNEVERRRFELAAFTPAPAARVETPPPCPVPQGQWQAGTWVWNLEAWVWLPGVWLSTARPVHRAVPVTPKP